MADTRHSSDQRPGGEEGIPAETEQIITAIRHGEVDAFVINHEGTPEIYTLVSARQALRETRDRLQLALDAAAMGTWDYDLVADTCYRDERHDELFGYDTPQPDWDTEIARRHIVEEDRAAFDRARERALETGEYRFEGRARWKDGSIHWLRAIGRTYYGAAGEPVRITGVVMDETDRWQAAEALRERDRQFSMVADNIPQLAWMMDPEGAISWYNRRWYEYTGGQPGQHLGRGWLEAHHPDHVARVAEGARRCLESGEPYRDVFPLRRHDGEYRWFLTQALPIWDEQGRITRWFGTNTDVTEQRQLEAALRELNDTLEQQVAERTAEVEVARDQFQTAFHASPAATAIMHRGDGRLLDVNAEYCRFSGFAREDVVGRTLVELGLWADPDDHWRLVRQVRRRRSVRNEEVRALGHAGTICTVLVSAEPIDLADGPCALVMFMDITERKQAEQTLRQLSSVLTLAEQRERRRLSEVLHDDLQQILFGAEMRTAMLKHGLAGEQPAAPEVLTEQVETLRQLLVAALETTRALSLELNPPVLRGEGLTPALVWLARHMEDMHGLAVEVDLPADVHLPVEDQRVLVVQLVRELLFNVVKHAGIRSARLTASGDDDRLVLHVEDEGVGFDAEARKQEPVHTDSLGLFSVEERLRLFGGCLEIDSWPGGGTRVRIEIPLVRDDMTTPIPRPGPA